MSMQVNALRKVLSLFLCYICLTRLCVCVRVCEGVPLGLPLPDFQLKFEVRDPYFEERKKEFGAITAFHGFAFVSALKYSATKN